MCTCVGMYMWGQLPGQGQSDHHWGVRPLSVSSGIICAYTYVGMCVHVWVCTCRGCVYTCVGMYMLGMCVYMCVYVHVGYVCIHVWVCTCGVCVYTCG